MKIIKFTALALILAIALNAFVGCAFLSDILGNGDTDNTDNPGEEDSNGPNAPDSLTFIINDREAFDEAFATAPFEVDFENETVLLYTYTTTTATPYVINDIFVDEHIHTVSIDIKHQRVNSSPDYAGTCEPTQSWLAVKMKKVNVSEVEFY